MVRRQRRSSSLNNQQDVFAIIASLGDVAALATTTQALRAIDSCSIGAKRGNCGPFPELPIIGPTKANSFGKNQ